jgi:glycosyltransferase involved in cell wall biosynthesis
MKITVITSPFGTIPPNAIGAVEKWWYNVAKIMCEKGHQVAFLSKRENENDRNGINKDGINVNYLQGFPVKNHIIKRLFFDLIYSLNALCRLKKTDILVMNTFWSPLLCILFKKKYIVPIYNVARIPKGQFKYYRYIERFACVSSAVYTELKKQIPTFIEKAKVIPNPVDTEFFYRMNEPDDSNKIVISYAGRVHPEKGLAILIKAFDTLKRTIKHTDIELRIIGAWDIEHGGGGEDHIRFLKQNTPFEIKFIDPVYNPKELSEEIAKCHIFCYPSVAEKGETFGIAPLEAMALERAVVVSDLDCFKDFVKDKKNAFVFNHRENAVENLTKILSDLITHRDLRLQTGIEAAKTALNFSTAKIADLYLNDFTELLNGKS